MEQSILKSTKQILGIDSDYTVFDLDIITHINTVFGTLHQLGVGPVEGFAIEDDTTTWDEFYTTLKMNPIKSYVYLRVRNLFDPPVTSYMISAMENQIHELEWRLTAAQETTEVIP